jgi:hypothetical protein
MKWLSLVAILLALETVPAISVTPQSGEPGAQFVVTGSGFEPGERVKVHWDGANLGGTSRVDTDGKFTYSGAVPDTAALGAHTIEAEAVGSGAGSASVSFTVGTGATSTSSTVTSTTSPPTTTTSPTVSSTTSSGAGSSTAERQTSETTASGATGSTALTSADDSGSTPTDSAAVFGETTDPPGDPRDTSVEAGDPLVGDSLAENPQAGSSGDRDARSSAGLFVALAVIGSVAAGTFFFWGRSRRDDEEQRNDQFPPSEEGLPLAPMSAADVLMNESGWAREMMALTPDGEITSLVATREGVIGVGTAIGSGGVAETSVWQSDDGVTWEGVAGLGVVGAAVPIVWRDGVLVTVSHEEAGGMRTACWRSDDGRSWEQLTDGGVAASLTGVSIEGAVALHDLVVAWGRDTDSPGVWLSGDGADWQRSTLQGGFDLMAHAGPGLLAFGRDLRERRFVMAYSADGVSWDEVDLHQSRMIFEGASIAALTAFQGGLVAVGTDITRGSGAVWVSDDGTGWYRAPFDPGVGTSIDYVSALEGRLLAVGTHTGRSRAGRGMPIIWESHDATSWGQIPVPEDVFSDAAVTALHLSSASILACGALWDKRGGVETASVPISWRWAPERKSQAGSRPGHDSMDQPVEEDTEVAAAGGVVRF